MCLQLILILKEIKLDINNIQLKDIWWEKIIDFIMWRIEYVRDLRDSVAE